MGKVFLLGQYIFYLMNELCILCQNHKINITESFFQIIFILLKIKV